MRIALAQINPTIGDVGGNMRLVLDAIEHARDAGADVLLCPELCILGYPPRDLLLREGIVDACERAVARLAQAAQDLTLIVGHPRKIPRTVPRNLAEDHHRRGIANSATICRDGEILGVYDKQLLPGYDVFDEDRYFEPGGSTCVVEIAGRRCGVLICEDIWRARDVEAGAGVPPTIEEDPVAETAAAGAQILFVLSASPFVLGKGERHLSQVRTIAKAHGTAVALANQVGANDDLIFDGRSCVVSGRGELLDLAASFTPELRIIDLDEASPVSPRREEPMHELFEALVVGVRDYVRKSSCGRVMLGLSGGIDSALTAAIAVAALGAENVTGVLMPSRYSSTGSVDDAKALASNLGIQDLLTIPIEGPHSAMEAALRQPLGSSAHGVTDENVQARLRGMILMAISNARGALVLATGNKSELAMGYCTLYGDMCGALAVLGDVLKTQVYELARWINANWTSCGFDCARRAPIPQTSIDKPPSAELRPNQTDQDTLPPYDVLDPIVREYVDHERSPEEVARTTGQDGRLVERICRTIDRAEFKRRQAAIVLKVSPRTFGLGRPMPVAMRRSSE